MSARRQEDEGSFQDRDDKFSALITAAELKEHRLKYNMKTQLTPTQRANAAFMSDLETKIKEAEKERNELVKQRAYHRYVARTQAAEMSSDKDASSSSSSSSAKSRSSSAKVLTLCCVCVFFRR